MHSVLLLFVLLPPRVQGVVPCLSASWPGGGSGWSVLRAPALWGPKVSAQTGRCAFPEINNGSVQTLLLLCLLPFGA